ncbi:hypothetical protein IAU59_003718 [Kwoniella sp. CBS 9459]
MSTLNANSSRDPPHPNGDSETETETETGGLPYDTAQYDRALHDNILLNPLYELRQTLSSIAFGITSSRIRLAESFPTTELELDSVRKESKELGRTSGRVVGRAEIRLKAQEGTVGVRLDAAGWTIESIQPPSSSSSSLSSSSSSPAAVSSRVPEPQSSNQPSAANTPLSSSDPAQPLPSPSPSHLLSPSPLPALPSWMRPVSSPSNSTSTSTSTTTDALPHSSPDPDPLLSSTSDATTTTTTAATANRSKIGRTYESLEALMIDISPAYSGAMNDEIWKRFGMSQGYQHGEEDDDDVQSRDDDAIS